MLLLSGHTLWLLEIWSYTIYNKIGKTTPVPMHHTMETQSRDENKVPCILELAKTCLK